MLSSNSGVISGITARSSSILTFTQTCSYSQQKQSIDNKSRTLSPSDAAELMNSVEFLEELVKDKDTIDEKYYGLYDPDQILSDENSRESENISYGNGSIALSINSNKEEISKPISVVEYTGILWFLSKRKVQFQESVRITNLSKCGKSTIECITRYKKKDNWVDCSRVLCSFQEKDNNQGLQMEIGSEILVRLPLLGVGGALNKKISVTFENATNSFFRKLGAANSLSNVSIH